jgi:diguanylate cyclase (GGDEF)-like protein/PAS domain S-box-containing protein
VVESIANGYGFTHVSLYLVEDDHLVMQHQVGYGDVSVLRIPVSRGIMGRVARTGQTEHLADVTQDPVFIEALPGIVSEICVPLFDRGAIAGVLNVESTGGVVLTEEELRVIEALGEYVSIAIERARLLAEARQSQEQFQTFMDHSPSVAFIKDPSGRLLFVNAAHEREFGVTAEELVGKTTVEWLGDELGAPLREHDLRVLESGEATEVVETVPGLKGVRHWLSHKFPIPDWRGGYLLGGVALDITERMRAEEAMRELTVRDELTGLYNRREMYRLLNEEVSRHVRYGRPTSLLMLDIDHFKRVNDTYGHQVGDEALKWIASLIVRAARSLDRPIRYGGEEFAVILPETTQEEAHKLAERLRRLIISHPFLHTSGNGGMVLDMTVSVGVASLPGVNRTAEALINGADRALYDAKRRGRNCVVSWSPNDSRRTAQLD